MKNNKRSKPSSKYKAPPNDQEGPASEEGLDEEPKIYKIVKRSTPDSNDRRDFIKKLGGASGLSALAAILSECSNSDYIVSSDGEKCTCHVVCTCDTEGNKQSRYNARWTSEYAGIECVCNTVCTCNTVCYCNTVCTCDSEGGGGGGGGGRCTCDLVHYWYPN